MGYPLQNYVDKQGPVVSAEWLNRVDAFVNTLFDSTITAAGARLAIGAAQSGVNDDITSITGLTGPVVLATDPGTVGQALLSGGPGQPPVWGPNGTAAVYTTTLGGGSFTLSGADSNSPTSTAKNYTTTPGPWAAGPGRQVFTAEFTGNNFFSLNPAAHFGFIMRSDQANPVNGHGLIAGYPGPLVAYSGATLALETWYPASGGGGALANYVWTPENLETPIVLYDGVPYHVTVISTVTIEGNKYVRSIVHKQTVSASGNGDTFWELVVDTGDVLDKNPWADFTKSEFAIFSVFNATLVGWSFAFTNAKVTWSQSLGETSDQSRNLIFHNGVVNVPANLSFVGDSRRIYVAETGIDWTKWTCLQNPNTNQSTSVCVIPNGTATTANFFAVNNSNNASNYGGITFGMQGIYGVIQSFGVGGAPNPEIVVSVGVGAVANLEAQLLRARRGVDVFEVDRERALRCVDDVTGRQRAVDRHRFDRPYAAVERQHLELDVGERPDRNRCEAGLLHLDRPVEAVLATGGHDCAAEEMEEAVLVFHRARAVGPDGAA